MNVKEFKRRGGTADLTEAFTALRDRHSTARTTHDLDLVAIGRELRTIREASGLSLRALAARIGLSAPFLCDVEHGRRRLSAAHGALWLGICAGADRLGDSTTKKP